ncbi:cyclic peptide export ABC transporter [Azohydromonas lata]|uniref:Cyclic peptide export ABC transporter n=1 Tax=Azohydromonas lata TaxID=45677 RepID=A0ABU5IDJ6_9BURK|nr:cyclic peptide export ABC transporter [Azohydromonas lata]MDZ5456894.1 cyclic peptide export ABC transporter [Azohydromonas lata]
MQQLWRFLTQEAGVPKARIVTMSLLAGGGNALMLALLNLAAASGEHAGQGRLFAAYLATFALHFYTQRRAMLQAMGAVERTVERLRLRITDKVRRAPLGFIEQAGGLPGFAALTQDTQVIAQSGSQVVTTLQSVVVLAFTTVYLAWLSPLACLAVVLSMGSFVLMRIVRQSAVGETMERAHAKEIEFQRALDDVVYGAKELRLSRRERQRMRAHLAQSIEESRALKLDAHRSVIFDQLFGGVALLLLLTAVVFVLPAVLPQGSQTTQQLVATILYILGPVSTLVQGLAALGAIEADIGHFYALEARLDATIEPHHRRAVPPLRQFREIRLERVSLRYLDADGTAPFTSGPHELTLVAGETVYVVGANGAGKSTLLKLVTGLRAAQRGRLLLDGVPVEPRTLEAYRSLFSAVFADFHLFPRLYGLPEGVDDAMVNAWIERLGLAAKTRCEGGRLTHTDLSTGQRKRLAFLVAVLEQRPICVFDELAADQDPAFRRRFYEELLPALKAQGRTLLVVSHDDAYFHCADRLLRLDAGRIVADTRQAAGMLPAAGTEAPA